MLCPDEHVDAHGGQPCLCPCPSGDHEGWSSLPAGQSLLVTGSARLDTFRQSGESLAGRRIRHLKAIFPGGDPRRYMPGHLLSRRDLRTGVHALWARFTFDLSSLPPTQLLQPSSGHVLEGVWFGLKVFEEHREQEPEVLSLLAKKKDDPFFDERSPMTYWEEMAEMPIMTTAVWWGIFTLGNMLNLTEIERGRSEGGRDKGEDQLPCGSSWDSSTTRAESSCRGCPRSCSRGGGLTGTSRQTKTWTVRTTISWTLRAGHPLHPRKGTVEEGEGVASHPGTRRDAVPLRQGTRTRSE